MMLEILLFFFFFMINYFLNIFVFFLSILLGKYSNFAYIKAGLYYFKMKFLKLFICFLILGN
jgi:hypothetical protein